MELEKLLGFLVDAGTLGVIVALLVQGTLRSGKVEDAGRAAERKLWQEAVASRDQRITELTIRNGELRGERDAWRSLSIGSERRLDIATPIVATVVGAPIPSLPSPSEEGAS